ncbi:MAG: hypothetical protein QOE90_1982 [Thermoplasmata archaeon]|jgi:hypothetical protein|nr:hypothetical protein [Thermoplasmata archaeon]
MRGLFLPLALSLLFAVPAASAQPSILDAVKSDLPLYVCLEGNPPVPRPSAQPCSLCDLDIPVCVVTADAGRTWDALS